MSEIKASQGILAMMENCKSTYYPPSKKQMEEAFKEIQKQNPPKEWIMWY